MPTASLTPAASEIPLLARALMIRSRGHAGDAEAFARRIGAPDRVLRAVSAITIADDAALADRVAMSRAFFPTMTASSAFFSLYNRRLLTHAPFITDVGTVTLGSTGYVVGEGQPIPVSQVTVAAGSIPRLKAAGMFVASRELVISQTPESQGLLTGELRKALGKIVDSEMISQLVATGTATVTATSDPLADVAETLLALSADGSDKLAFIFATDAAKRASCATTAGGALAFPGMTPAGGEIAGVPAVVSSGLTAGTALLLDGAQILANASEIALESSGEASVQITDSPTNDVTTPTATTLTSLFQTDSLGVRATVDFGLAAVRDAAVVELSGIGWAYAAS